MIRASELAGRAVVDLDAAEKIGSVDKIILDPDGRRVAGFVVARARSGFPGTRAHVLIPSSAVRAIGPDALTIHQGVAVAADNSRLDTLPKGSDVIGRKVVSADGRFLGKVSDILIEPVEGRIYGYLLTEHTPGPKWEEILGGDKKRRQAPFLPAETRIHPGRDLIVASEEAVGYGWPDDDTRPAESGAPPANWGYADSPDPIEAGPREGTWTRTGEDEYPARTTLDESGDLEEARKADRRLR